MCRAGPKGPCRSGPLWVSFTTSRTLSRPLQENQQRSPIDYGTHQEGRECEAQHALDTEQFGGRAGSFKIAECQIKPYPAQALLQTAIAAAAKVGKAIPDTETVRSIVIATSHVGHQYAAESPEKFAPKTRETADHSLPYIVVRAMLDHEIKDSSYSDDALKDPRLVALLKKLTVEEDDAWALISNMA